MWSLNIYKKSLQLLAPGSLGANFFSCPESGFIWHQPPPPRRQSTTTNRIKVIYLRCTVEKSVPHLPWLPTSAPRGCLQKQLQWHHQSNRWLEGSENYSGIDHSEQTDPNWGSIFCLCPDQSPGRTVKRKKEAKNNNPLSTVKIPLLMRLSTLPDRCSTGL